MKFLLKFATASIVAICLGVGSVYVALRAEAERGSVSITSQNPYERAAYAARDFLPDARRP